MRTIKERIGGLAVRVAILLAAHAVLIRWMAATDAASVIFAPGPHVPFPHLLLAAVFVTVRLATVLFVPGYLFVAGFRLAREALHRRQAISG